MSQKMSEDQKKKRNQAITALMSALSHSQMQTVLVNSTAEGVEGGDQEVKEKTPSVFSAGMFMAGLTCGRLGHGLGLLFFLSRSGFVRCILYSSVVVVNLSVTRESRTSWDKFWYR